MFHKTLRGTDLHAPSNELVENNTGSTIPKMKVVTLNGMGSIYPQVAIQNPLASPAFGIANEDLVANKPGFVTCIGFMFNLNTSLWPEGTLLYSSATGDLTTSVPIGDNNTPIASVVRSDPLYGVLYVTAIADQFLPLGQAWAITGNAGLDPDLNFLGTSDAVPVRIRTDNVKRMEIDAVGRVGIGDVVPDTFIHIKAHAGFGDQSGVKIDTFAMSSTALTPVNAYTIPVPNQTVMMVQVKVVANQGNSERCAIHKTACVFRNGSLAQLQYPVQSTFTSKSKTEFELDLVLSGNSLLVRVTNATTNQTDWVGSVEILQGGST